MKAAKPRPFGGAVAGASPLGVSFPSRTGPLELLRTVFSSSDGTLPLKGFRENLRPAPNLPEGLDETPSGEAPATAPPARTRFAQTGRPTPAGAFPGLGRAVSMKPPHLRAPPPSRRAFRIITQRILILRRRAPSQGAARKSAPCAPWVFATEHTETAFGGHGKALKSLLPPAGLNTKRHESRLRRTRNRSVPSVVEHPSTLSWPAKRAFVSFRVRPSGHRKGQRRFRRNRPTKPRHPTPDTKH